MTHPRQQPIRGRQREGERHTERARERDTEREREEERERGTEREQQLGRSLFFHASVTSHGDDDGDSTQLTLMPILASLTPIDAATTQKLTE